MEHVANPPVRKAKRVIWRGWTFESQTECSVAMFLIALGIPFMYEAEAYLPDDGRPTRPDFWLPDQSAWLEVKGHDDYDPAQVQRLSAVHDELLYVATAPLWYSAAEGHTGKSMQRWLRGYLVEVQCEFCRCLRCGDWTIEYRGWHSKHGCDLPKNYTNAAGDAWSLETRAIIRAAGHTVETWKAFQVIGR
jgi:hypothetical protein